MLLGDHQIRQRHSAVAIEVAMIPRASRRKAKIRRDDRQIRPIDATVLVGVAGQPLDDWVEVLLYDRKVRQTHAAIAREIAVCPCRIGKLSKVLRHDGDVGTIDMAVEVRIARPGHGKLADVIPARRAVAVAVQR